MSERPESIGEHPEVAGEPLESIATEPLGGSGTAEPAVPSPAAPPDAPQRAQARGLRRFPSPHADKFRVALAALVGVGVGAVIIAIMAATSASKQSASVSWSQWSPSSSGAVGVQEIADFVAPYYRLTSSQQLDVITPISLTSQTAAGTTTGKGLTVAVNTATSGSGSQSLSLLSGKTVAYNVCGLGGSDCALAGAPSTERMLLLRREALQLALYTFKYIANTQNVLVVLPPGHSVTPAKQTSTGAAGATTTAGGSSTTAGGSSTTAVGSSTNAGGGGASTSSTSGPPLTVAVLFVRAQVAQLLNLPIDSTLQQFAPSVAQLPLWVKSNEAGLVDAVTAHGLFSEQLESQQVGGNLLVLTQLPAQ